MSELVALGTVAALETFLGTHDDRHRLLAVLSPT
jgi:hypothetical protein